MVQPEGLLPRPTPLDKTLSERRGDGEGEEWKQNKKGRQRSSFSYYSSHLNCLNKDSQQTVHRTFLLRPNFQRVVYNILPSLGQDKRTM